MASAKNNSPSTDTYRLDSWCFEETGFDAESHAVVQTLTAQANGYIGTRGTYEEPVREGILSIEGTYLNGVYVRPSIHYDENAHGFASHNNKMILVPDAKNMRVEADGEMLEQGSRQIISQRRSLDMKNGLLDRSSSWTTRAGSVICINSKRMVCAAHPNLMVLDYEIISTNYTGQLTLETGLDANYGNPSDTHDPRAGALSIEDCLSNATCHSDTILTAVSHKIVGRERTILTACLIDVESTSVLEQTSVERDGFWGQHITLTLNAGDRLRVRKYIYYADCPVSDIPVSLSKAKNVLITAQTTGFNRLLEEQRSRFVDFWAVADIDVSGNANVQRGMRFNLFHLFQSAGKDGQRSLSAKGLTGPGYDGHYFWDTEIYAVPFFIFTQPRIARALISYRIAALDAARQRAREMGHPSGALYPWRTISGEECSSFFPAGSAQYHINAAIAYALMQYCDATGDDSLLYEGGAEMLFETARIWRQLGHFSEQHGGKFSIHEVTGPDEYSAMVDNNLYTNLMARYHLERAANLAETLSTNQPKLFDEIEQKISLQSSEIEIWRQAAKAMYVPYNAAGGVHEQHDGFLAKPEWDFTGTPDGKYPLLLHYHPLVIYRHQVLKQADVVLAQILLPTQFKLEEKVRNLSYYEPRTTHDSTLSACIYSIANSESGDKVRAYEMFEETYRMDLENRHANTHYGLHMACMAGSWMAMAYGFGGMRFVDKNLLFNPYLPDDWDDFSFRLVLRGRILKITVRADGTTYLLEKGRELEIQHRNKAVYLAPATPVSLV